MKLVENRVCRLLGEALLKPSTRFILIDFLKAWQDSVPEGNQYSGFFSRIKTVIHYDKPMCRIIHKFTSARRACIHR